MTKEQDVKYKTEEYTGLLSSAVRADFDTIRTAHWAVAERIA